MTLRILAIMHVYVNCVHACTHNTLLACWERSWHVCCGPHHGTHDWHAMGCAHIALRPAMRSDPAPTPHCMRHHARRAPAVTSNRITTVICIMVYSLLARRTVRPVAPLSAYGAVSVSNLISTSCQYEALKYVSFASQTLAKSAKVGGRAHLCPPAPHFVLPACAARAWHSKDRQSGWALPPHTWRAWNVATLIFTAPSTCRDALWQQAHSSSAPSGLCPLLTP